MDSPNKGREPSAVQAEPLTAQIKRLPTFMHPRVPGPLVQRDEVFRLLASQAVEDQGHQDRADAERYRWLRDRTATHFAKEFVEEEPDKWDAAIDDDMGRRGGGGLTGVSNE